MPETRGQLYEGGANPYPGTLAGAGFQSASQFGAGLDPTTRGQFMQGNTGMELGGPYAQSNQFDQYNPLNMGFDALRNPYTQVPGQGSQFQYRQAPHQEHPQGPAPPPAPTSTSSFSNFFAAHPSSQQYATQGGYRQGTGNPYGQLSQIQLGANQ